MVYTPKKNMKDIAFSETEAAKRLKQYAENPPDLTKQGGLTPERISHYVGKACGFQLLYGTERVNNEIMDELVTMATECGLLDKIHRMQSGEVINCIKGYPSENRAVLHTATRNFFHEKSLQGPAKEAQELAKAEIDKLKNFSSQIEAEKRFKDLIMVGIGGSDLGPYANFCALEHLKKADRRLFFINNIDPDNTAIVLNQAKLSESLVVVISKSGTTLETCTNEAFLRARFLEAGLDPANHFVAVTGEGSPMDDSKKYLESFYIWDWIGGRFSTTSMVGGVMLSFAFGFDVFYELLRGASDMDRASLKNDIIENLPLLGALLSIWNHNFLKYPTLAIIPYSRALSRYPAHIQQVEMESNGKHINRFGERLNYESAMIVWGEPGTCAQHSFYQLIHQGTQVVPLELIGFKESQMEDDYLFRGTTNQEKLLSNLFAQAIALATGKKGDNPNKEFEGNRPSHILLAEKATPYSIGALLSYFENKVAFEGFLWNVNSFDQEGVQLGKVLANQVLERFAAMHGEGEDIPHPLADSYIGILDNF